MTGICIRGLNRCFTAAQARSTDRGFPGRTDAHWFRPWRTGVAVSGSGLVSGGAGGGVLNRLLDGLDGALARRRGLTDAGGFLDIALDFLFYALVPFGFILADPSHNALAGSWLLFAFIGTGSSFLAFAALAAKHNIDNPGYAHKSFYYLGGLTEGTETIALFVLGCLFPAYFAVLAWIFGALCWMTTLTRVWSGYLTLKGLQRQKG